MPSFLASGPEIPPAFPSLHGSWHCHHEFLQLKFSKAKGAGGLVAMHVRSRYKMWGADLQPSPPGFSPTPRPYHMPVPGTQCPRFLSFQWRVLLLVDMPVCLHLLLPSCTSPKRLLLYSLLFNFAYQGSGKSMSPIFIKDGECGSVTPSCGFTDNYWDRDRKVFPILNQNPRSQHLKITFVFLCR